MQLQKPAFRSILKILLFLGIAGLSLMTTIGYFSLSTLIASQNQTKYERQTKQISTLIAEHMNTHADILYRARAYILVNRTPAENEWETFFNNQQAFQSNVGIQSVAFSPYLKGKSQAAAEKEVSQKHKTTLKITPAGNRDEYAPLTLIASTNPAAYSAAGFDILSEAVRREAVTKAKTTGQPILTPPVQLVGYGQTGVIMVLPIYIEGNQLYGFVTAVYTTDSFLHGLIDTDLVGGLSTEIIDANSNQAILKSGAAVKGATVTRTDKMAIAGRDWIINYAAPSQVFGDGHLVPNIILAVGSIFILVSIFAARTILKLTDPKNQT